MNKVWTSEEVVKGLECCSDSPLEDCTSCPFFDVAPRCDDYLMKEAAALIRRRDAVIAKLEDIINSRKDGVEE